jgi:5-methylcytosine-specific restriction endonuclease McrA
VKVTKRKAIPVGIQLEVFFRDRWLCHVCRRPLVFPFALKQLAELVDAEGREPLPSYFNLNWRRDKAPLLDELGASIDHVHAWSAGGGDAAENLAAICSRCNVRKSASTLSAFIESSKPWKVKGKHGEPLAWDGLTAVFVTLASRSPGRLSAAERRWLAGLRAYHASRPST